MIHNNPSKNAQRFLKEGNLLPSLYPISDLETREIVTSLLVVLSSTECSGAAAAEARSQVSGYEICLAHSKRSNDLTGLTLKRLKLTYPNASSYLLNSKLGGLLLRLGRSAIEDRSDKLEILVSYSMKERYVLLSPRFVEVPHPGIGAPATVVTLLLKSSRFMTLMVLAGSVTVVTVQKITKNVMFRFELRLD
ncbi:hypothetical protein AKJ16_DCAP08170 [Drosera capensis]